MINNIDFELFSILILTVLILYNFFKVSENKRYLHLFQRMILLDLLMCLAESTSVVMRSGYFENIKIIYLSTTIYLMCFSMISYQFFAYVILNIEGEKRIESLIRFWRIPVIVLEVLVFTNSLTNLVFTMDPQGMIRKGFGWGLVMWTSVLYSFAITIIIFYRWKRTSVSLKLSAMLYVLFSFIYFLIQILINEEIMIAGALIALSLIIIQLNLQNPQMIHEAVAKEQEEKLTAIRENREKSDFMANMSHEIRTPLNVIVSMNEMILRENKSELVEEYAKNVKTSADILDSIINNVFDMTRVEVGKLQVVEEWYDTGLILKELIAIGMVRAEDKNLVFLTKIAKNLPKRIYGDSQRIRQIVMNLITNSIKYTKNGAVTFSFRIDRIEGDGEENKRANLVIEVKDTGIGIAQDQLMHIFDAYARADIEKKLHVEGAGLGLAIVKKFTEMMEGTVTVESEEGVGSTFTVVIPQNAYSDEQMGEFVMSGEENEKKKSGKAHSFLAPKAKILIVDDNEMNRKAIKCLLERTQMQIDLVESGMECLEKIKKSKYNIILLDYMMPEMDGMETFLAMKELSCNLCSDTPVIALTANTSADARGMFMEAGFSAYLTKPVRWEKLEALVITFLPEELVIQTQIESTIDKMGRSIFEECEKILADADISFVEGLYYVSGDIEQYRKQVKLFLELFDQGRDELEKLYEIGDLKRLAIRIHALKGNAKGIGATDLYYTARRMEQRCYQNDSLYISTTIGHLLMESKRAREGFEKFEQRCRLMEEQQNKEQDKKQDIEQDKIENPLQEREYMQMLSQQVELGLAMEGVKTVEKLMKYTTDKDKAKKLSWLKEALLEFDYEEANSIIAEVNSDE